MTTEQRPGRDAPPAVEGLPQHDAADAVAQAARWLADQGVAVPGVEVPGGEVPGVEVPGVEAGRAANRSSREVGGGPSAQRASSASRRPGPAADPGSDDPETKARGVVLRKLTGQARTRHELDQALKTKEIPQAVANQVLDRMAEIGLVDDAAFARDWVGSRQQRRQLSRRALRHELQHKGVDRDDIEEALAAVDGDDEYEAARALAERKARGMAGLSREVRSRRIAGALARRGFGSGLISRVIAEVATDLD